MLDPFYIRPFDLLACADSSLISKAIRWTTGGNVSHVAPVYEVWRPNDIELVEPTMSHFGQIKKTQLHDRLDDYESNGGKVYLLHLKQDILTDVAAAKLFMTRMIGRPYGFWQALGSAVPWIRNRNKYHRPFCSLIAAGVYASGRALPGHLNIAEVHPFNMVQVQLWSDYQQLVGKKQELKGFNSIPVDRFARHVMQD